MPYFMLMLPGSTLILLLTTACCRIPGLTGPTMRQGRTTSGLWSTISRACRSSASLREVAVCQFNSQWACQVSDAKKVKLSGKAPLGHAGILKSCHPGRSSLVSLLQAGRSVPSLTPTFNPLLAVPSPKCSSVLRRAASVDRCRGSSGCW